MPIFADLGVTFGHTISLHLFNQISDAWWHALLLVLCASIPAMTSETVCACVRVWMSRCHVLICCHCIRMKQIRLLNTHEIVQLHLSVFRIQTMWRLCKLGFSLSSCMCVCVCVFWPSLSSWYTASRPALHQWPSCWEIQQDMMRERERETERMGNTC